MKLRDCYFSLVLFAAINAIVIDQKDEGLFLPAASSSLACPDYQLKCPNCPEGQVCVYPDSEGCSGAGIPICQALDCHGIVCLTKRLPCPDECPFTCRYNGPPCCPFLGQPVCEPTCQTFVACKVTPCPSECPSDCHYPHADYCCPKSGEAVCNNHSIGKRALDYESGELPENFEWYNGYAPDDDSWGYQSFGYGHQAYQNVHQELDHRQNHQHNDHAYLHGDHRHEHGDKDGCPICTKTVIDVSVQLEFVTTTREPGMPIECGNHIVPCPYECPYNCIYPMNERCPFTKKPWCPSILDQTQVEEQDCDTIYNTEGYPYPYFPSYDPYHEIFTSILNRSGVTSTPSFVTQEPTEVPSVFCPLIFILCPPECPDTCLRQDVPCPFATDGYCPGNEPPALSSDSIAPQVTTPVEVTLSDGAVLCPMYMLACPYCPENYYCTRETTGYCPNTNVPYCFSTAPPTPTISSTVAPLFEFYPEPYPPQPTKWRGWGQFDNLPDLPENFIYHAMSLFSDGRESSASNSGEFSAPEQIDHYQKGDACQKAGYVRITEKQIFEQAQAALPNCEGCPLLEWDDQCDNVCIFRTEKDCCIQTTCFPNSH